jgi:hypothetical protein
MYEVQFSELDNELKKIKLNERLFINIDKRVCDSIKLLDLQCKSYDNLFMSYINNTHEDANKFNVENFLNKYTEAFTKMELFKDIILREALGKSYKYFKQNEFRYIIDYELNILIIFKAQGGIR